MGFPALGGGRGEGGWRGARGAQTMLGQNPGAACRGPEPRHSPDAKVGLQLRLRPALGPGKGKGPVLELVGQVLQNLHVIWGSLVGVEWGCRRWVRGHGPAASQAPRVLDTRTAAAGCWGWWQPFHGRRVRDWAAGIPPCNASGGEGETRFPSTHLDVRTPALDPGVEDVRQEGDKTQLPGLGRSVVCNRGRRARGWSGMGPAWPCCIPSRPRHWLPGVAVTPGHAWLAYPPPLHAGYLGENLPSAGFVL